MDAKRKSVLYIPENLDFLNIQNLGERLNEEEIEGLLDEADLEGKVFIFTIFFYLTKLFRNQVFISEILREK